MQNAINHFGERDNVRYCANIKDCLCNAQVILILTEWPEFKNLQLTDVASLLCADVNTPKLFIDLRNLYEPNSFAGLNMRYVSLGRAEFAANSFKAQADIHEH